MSNELKAPAWLDDVISNNYWTEPHEGTNYWRYEEVERSILNALQRHEAERPARRPWAGMAKDLEQPGFNAELVAFSHWLVENQDEYYMPEAVDEPDQVMLIAWLHGLFYAAYEGRQPGESND